MKEFSNFKQSTENMQNKDKYLKEEKEFFDFFNEYCDYIAEPAHGIIPASTTEMEKLIEDIRLSVLQKRSKICKSKAKRKSLGARPPTLTTIKKEEHIEKFIKKIENLEKSYSENKSFFELLLSDIGKIKEEKSDKDLYEKIKELDKNKFNSVKHENDDGNVFNESWSVICGAIHKSAEQEPKGEEEWKKFRKEILVLLEVAGNKAKKFQTDYQKQIKVKM